MRPAKAPIEAAAGTSDHEAPSMTSAGSMTASVACTKVLTARSIASSQNTLVIHPRVMLRLSARALRNLELARQGVALGLRRHAALEARHEGVEVVERAHRSSDRAPAY